MKGLLLAAFGAIAVAGTAGASEFGPQLGALAEGELAAWIDDPAVIDAVRAQNAAHEGIAQADIDAMDTQWRSEVAAAGGALIDEVMGRPGSDALRARKESAGGLVTEVFVTDAHGLNVIQSDVTSDYWQGDEEKFTETFGKADGFYLIGEVEFDESTQTYQSQVSMPINDPDTGAPIGSVTFGVNLELLQ